MMKPALTASFTFADGSMMTVEASPTSKNAFEAAMWPLIQEAGKRGLLGERERLVATDPAAYARKLMENINGR